MQSLALGTAPSLKLQGSSLMSDCSCAAPLQVTSPTLPQFSPAPSVFLQGGIDCA